jgi:hypothetical protein
MSEYRPSQIGVELSDHRPPMEFVFSKTMGDKPFSLAYFAASNPAGPAPTIATRFDVIVLIIFFFRNYVFILNFILCIIFI